MGVGLEKTERQKKKKDDNTEQMYEQLGDACGQEKDECIGCRCGSDPTLLWLWRRLAATAPIQPLAWERPYATGAALQKKKKKEILKVRVSIFPQVGPDEGL